MANCLIIEDSEVIRDIMHRILNEMGHDVVEADGAEVGIDLFASTEPELVFLDWDLPSLAAFDVLRAFSKTKITQKPKIILCLTENDPRQIALAKAAGAKYHLLKPFDRKGLLAVMQKAGFNLDVPLSDVYSA